MARTISTPTITSEAGTKVTKTERTCVEINIDVDPRRPKSLRLYYADVITETFTPAGGGNPVVTVKNVDRVGMIEVPESELASMPVFPGTYAALKAKADEKSAAVWPDLNQDGQ